MPAPNNLIFQELFDGGDNDKVANNLDTTLKVSGKAADAKATGDALEKKANTTDLANYAPKDSIVTVDDTLAVQGQAADAKKTGQRITQVAEWIEDHESESTIHHFLDATLTKQGQAADAKAVGDAISTHNTKTDAHNDIRIALQELADKVNAVLDSDDKTLDELSEIVAYIKNNKTLIENVTTSKVNVADIVNNLTSNVTNKPLSAAQGVALKALIDAIVVPTRVSQLENDAGYAKTADHYNKTESDNKYAVKSNTVDFEFVLKDGTTTTKKVVLA